MVFLAYNQTLVFLKSNADSIPFCSFSFCDVMYISVGIMGFLTFDDSFASQFNISVPKKLYAYEIAT